MDVQHKTTDQIPFFAKVQLRPAEYADFEMHPRKDLLGFYFFLKSQFTEKIEGPYVVKSYTNMKEFEYWYKNKMMYVCCSVLDGEIIIDKPEPQTVTN